MVASFNTHWPIISELGPGEGSAISLMFTKDIISLSQRSAWFTVWLDSVTA